MPGGKRLGRRLGRVNRRRCRKSTQLQFAESGQAISLAQGNHVQGTAQWRQRCESTLQNLGVAVMKNISVVKQFFTQPAQRRSTETDQRRNDNHAKRGPPTNDM